MDAFLNALGTATAVLRVVFLVGAVGASVLCAVEWGVRTRRLNAFSRVARTTRRISSPIVSPVERSVVRAGGNPASAPVWTLMAVIVAGIIVLQTLEFLRFELARTQGAFAAGARGVALLALNWTFVVVYLALLVRVVSSWIRMNPFGRLIRWSYTLTEPLLAPIRRVLPAWGAIDLSPLVAYFGLRVLQWLIGSALAGAP